MLQCLYGTLQLLTTCHYDTLQLHDNLQLQLVTKMCYSYDTLQLQLFMRLHLQLVTLNRYFTFTTCHYDALQLQLVTMIRYSYDLSHTNKKMKFSHYCFTGVCRRRDRFGFGSL